MLETGSEPHDLAFYLRVLRRRAWIVALLTIVCMAAGAAYSLRQPKLYRASVAYVFYVPRTGADPSIQTMSELLKTNRLAQAVVGNLVRRTTAAHLMAHLHVATEPDTLVIRVSYDDTSPKAARETLETVGGVFGQMAQKLLDQEAGLSGSQAARQVPHQVDVTSAPSAGRVQPKPLRNVVLAGMLGLLLGVVAAFVREQFDDTVRGVSEAEDAFGQGATATLPPRLLGNLSSRPQGRRGLDPALAELAVQRLAANLLWPSQAQGGRAVLVTSAQPEEGKSTVAANLAVELAVSGRRVIVVEADLRRPVLHRYLGLEPPAGVGLDAVIRNRATLTAALLEVPVRAGEGEAGGRLQAILAAPGQAWPSEAERVLQVLEALRRRADYVIFDAPPTLVVPDAYPLVAAVDVVVAVIRSGKSSAPATAALSRHLQRLKARRVELVITDAEEPYEHTYYHAYLTRRGSRPHGRAETPPASAEPADAVGPPPEHSGADHPTSIDVAAEAGDPDLT